MKKCCVEDLSGRERLANYKHAHEDVYVYMEQGGWRGNDKCFSFDMMSRGGEGGGANRTSRK